MSILTECLQRAEQQQGIATEAMAALHKIQAIAIGSAQCLTVNDYQNAMRHILNTINASMDNIDGLLGIEHDAKPQPDHTDIVGNSPLS